MMEEAIYSFDFGILDFIRENIANPVLDGFFSVITHLGDAGIFWIILCVVLLISKKYRSTGIIMAIALTAMLITGNVFLKNLIARDRPFIQNPDIMLIIPPPSGFSFPSGHSFSSFTAATVLFMCHKKWGIPALILAALIAVSRIYLYVHFPTDIICGSLFGIILGILSVKLCRKYLPEKIMGKTE